SAEDTGREGQGAGHDRGGTNQASRATQEKTLRRTRQARATVPRYESADGVERPDDRRLRRGWRGARRKEVCRCRREGPELRPHQSADQGRPAPAKLWRSARPETGSEAQRVPG